ncbi:MAG: hypothetical protein ACRC14_19825 [Paracoccaceae bacterium]
MKYDDASWHSDGEFPEASPEEYAGTHIALFVKWCFLRGWAGEELLEDCPDDVARVISGQMSATDFLFKNCDGKLADADLNPEGNAFASEYYSESGSYTDDYAKHFDGFVYLRPESDHDFAKFTAMVDERLLAFLQSQNPTEKPWWKIW